MSLGNSLLVAVYPRLPIAKPRALIVTFEVPFKAGHLEVYA
jgi:hypothetical protein